MALPEIDLNNITSARDIITECKNEEVLIWFETGCLPFIWMAFKNPSDKSRELVKDLFIIYEKMIDYCRNNSKKVVDNANQTV